MANPTYRACVVAPFGRDFISAADLGAVGRHIAGRDPTLLWKPVPVSDSSRPLIHFRAPTLATMLVQFHGFRYPPLPDCDGPRLECHPLHKATQLAMLEEAGLPVPPWAILTRDTEIDAAAFGDHLIVKPTEFGASLGQGVQLIRTDRFETYRDRHAPAYEAPGRSPPIVQKFIRTGANALHFRAITFMGRVVHSAALENVAPIPFDRLASRLALSEAVASNAGERRGWLFEDAEIFALAGRIASVFDSPVIGIDFLRSEDTGELFVLEANMGNVWLFSSKLGRAARRRLGIDAIRQQHDVFAVVADAIVERARRELPAQGGPGGPSS